MRLLALFVTFGVAAASPEAEVRGLRVRLAKVLANSAALPKALVAEAKHADDTAAHALKGGSQKDLEDAEHEYSSFTTHLSDRADQLRKEAASKSSPPTQDGVDASAFQHAAALVPELEAKCEKVLSHLHSDKEAPAEEAAEKKQVEEKLERALRGKGTGVAADHAALARAVELHEALKSAHNYLQKRAKELNLDRTRLAAEIEEQQVFILYMMLRQRRKLPLKAQLALLKRHQFKDCSYAQQLLKVHKDSEPLCDQLMAAVPKALAEAVKSKEHRPTAGALSAAGSDGRVQIVSSRMKNAVKAMASELAVAKEQLAGMVNGNVKGVSAAEKAQAKEILTGLEDVLRKVSTTKDLKSQMDAMTEVENKLKTWMSNAKRLSSSEKASAGK